MPTGVEPYATPMAGPVRQRQLFWRRFVGSSTTSAAKSVSNQPLSIQANGACTWPAAHGCVISIRPCPSSSSSAPAPAPPRGPPPAELSGIRNAQTMMTRDQLRKACVSRSQSDLHTAKQGSDPSHHELLRADSEEALRLSQRWQKTLKDLLLTYRTMDLGAHMAFQKDTGLPHTRRKKLKTLLHGCSIASSSARSLALASSSSRSLAFTSNSAESLGLADRAQEFTGPVPTTGTSAGGDFWDSAFLQGLAQTSPEPEGEGGEDGSMDFASVARDLVAHSNNIAMGYTSLHQKPTAKEPESAQASPSARAAAKPDKACARQQPLEMLQGKRSNEPPAQSSTKLASGDPCQPLILSAGKPLKTEQSQNVQRHRHKNTPVDNFSLRQAQQPKRNYRKTIIATSGMSGSDANEAAEEEDTPFGRMQSLKKTLDFRGHGKQSTKATAGNDSKKEFQRLAILARKYHMTIDDLRDARDEFAHYDKVNSGTITAQEFQRLVRARCNLPTDKPFPLHLLNALGSMNIGGIVSGGTVSFEDFLVWTIHCAYTEEFMVPNASERQIRQLAREQKMSLLDVEKIKCVFDSFDVDGSGEIEECEFRNILYGLWDVRNEADVSDKKLQRYWRELDFDGSGSCNFEEFLIWYTTNFKDRIAKL